MNTRRSPAWMLAALLLAAAPSPHAQLRLPGQGGVAPVLPAGAAPAPMPTPAAGGRSSSEPALVDRVVAVVNSEAITARELDTRTRSILARLRGQNVQLPPMDELQRQVLERMIVDRAAQQAARDAGIRIDDAAVDRAVARIAADQKLSVAQLRQRIEGDGLNFAAFRQEITHEMAVARLRERDIESKIQVSEAEVDALLAEQAGGTGPATEYNVAQILVRVPDGAPPDVVERLRVRAEAIAREARGGVDFGRLAANLSDGSDAITGGVLGPRTADRLPPLFVQAVEPLAPGEVAPVVRSQAGFHVIKLVDRRNGGLGKAAGGPVRQTRARHILVRVDELNAESEVVRRLTEIRGRLEAGTVTFADMARQYSKDPTAFNGGDLGWVYPGDTVPEFERAMDELEPGKIAGPVRTPFGYHLIEVVERRTDEASPDRIRAAARSALRERKSAEAYQEWLSQIRSSAYVDLRLDER
ncbi:MAG: parvulin-like peptidyl-prolyl cis-trans isomerase protein [Pseudomonadota bacterium]|jgi:peptidyl-prolyl cis-trans isomerase SurA